MVWKSFTSHAATLASRPRLVTTTFMCALSATVRLTSTADQGPKVPLQSVHARNPLVSIMTADGVPIFCRGTRPKPVQPTVFRGPRGCHIWPL
jgi:hypothetical protein